MNSTLKTVLIVVAVVFVLGGGAFAACTAFVGGVANEIDQDLNRERHLVYRATSDTDGASVSWADADGSSLNADFDGEWEQEVVITNWEWTYMDVTSGWDGGTVTCTIEENGVVIAQNTATGVLASASCNP